MLAAELAMRLGADLGLESVADIWAEITSVAPSHAGITADVLAATGDGVVAPLHAAPLQTTVVDDHGIAVGGTDIGPEGGAAQAEVDQDDAPEPSGEGAAEGDSGPTGPEGAEADDAELTESDHEGGGDAATVDLAEGPDDEQDEGATSPLVRFVIPEPTPVPPVDSYALRLVVSRTLYDDGTLTQAAPAIAGLAGDAPLRVHPTVLERLGVEAGSRVRASSPRATVTLTAVADPGVPRGVAAVALRRSGGAGDLIDVGQTVTEVRVETTT
jgi:hypothetical protein